MRHKPSIEDLEAIDTMLVRALNQLKGGEVTDAVRRVFVAALSTGARMFSPLSFLVRPRAWPP